MFPAKYRLNTQEFERTMTRGSSFTSKYFYLKVFKNNTGKVKIGVAVSKKLAINAVVKNYYKITP